jgi:hypothetical protein
MKNGGLGFDAKIPSLQNSPGITIPKFIEEMPVEILKKQTQNNVPVIMGANRHDGSFAFEDIYRKYLIENDLLDDKVFMRNEVLPGLIKAMSKFKT